MDLISVIVPCYNEEESLPQFYEKVCAILGEIETADYELLFIDDGSKDRTLSLLKMFSQLDGRAKYLSFSRNFGKEAAMYAGLQQSTGNYAVIMDADLQHPPELLTQMYRTLKTEPVDCVGAKRIDREGEKGLRRVLSQMFYRIMYRISSVPMADGEGDYRMMTRQMVDSIVSMREYNRYSKGLFQFVGFETTWIPYHYVPRTAGKTKWSFCSLFQYAIEGIFSFSAVPLSIATICGAAISAVASVMALVLTVQTLVLGNPLNGWTALLCVVLLIGGIQLFFIGIVGQYLSKDYLESKQRPIYIIKEKCL